MGAPGVNVRSGTEMAVHGCRSCHTIDPEAHGFAYERRDVYELGNTWGDCEQILGGAGMRADAGCDHVVVPEAGQTPRRKPQRAEGVPARNGSNFARQVL